MLDKILSKTASIRQLIRNGVLYFMSGSILIRLLSFLSSIIIARLVDKAEYACFSYADNIYSYLLSIGGLGLATALLRSAAKTEDKGLRSAYYRFALKYGSLIQLTLALIVVAFVSLIDLPFAGTYGYFWALAPYPILYYIYTTISNYLRVHYKNKLYFELSVLLALLTMAITVGLSKWLSAYSVALARCVSCIIVILIGVRHVRKDVGNPVDGLPKLTRKQEREYLSSGIAMMTATFFSTIMMSNNTFLVNNLVREEIATANYKIAILFPTQLTVITNAIINYAFPRVAKDSDNKIMTWKNSISIGVVNFFAVALTALIGYALSDVLLSVLYGDKYLDSLELMRIFWIIYGINAGFRMVPMNIMTMIGYEKLNSVISVICCIVHIALTIPLILRFGINGSVYALAIIYPVTGLFYWWLLYRKTAGCVSRKNNSMAHERKTKI